MLRLLHTSDWKVGLKASHVASAGEAVRAARLEAAREVIAIANRERVDAVLLAGDTFEHNLVEDRLVHEVVKVLAAANSPVFVLPGNHDALSHDSVFRRASWRNRCHGAPRSRSCSRCGSRSGNSSLGRGQARSHSSGKAQP